MWLGLDALQLRGYVLDVGRGDWQQGQSASEPLINPKWLAYVTVDGRAIYGDVPTMPSVPATVHYAGELPWDQRLRLDLSGYADGKPHVAEVHRYAASYFKGWGDHPEDAWEWGHYSADDKGTPAQTTLPFTLGLPAPRPRDAPDVPGAITAIDEAIRALEASWGYKLTKRRYGSRFASSQMGRARGRLDVALYRLRPP